MSEIRIPSIEIPKITFPTIVLPSIGNISTNTWLIIVFVLVMFLLSCMTTRACKTPPVQYIEIDDVKNLKERFEMNSDGNPVDHLDAGQGFAPKPSYSCSLQTRCLPGERDTEKWCIKEGCPEGTERGIGLGKEFCYPKCIMGYESDGGSRCWKKCPEGWTT